MAGSALEDRVALLFLGCPDLQLLSSHKTLGGIKYEMTNKLQLLPCFATSALFLPLFTAVLPLGSFLRFTSCIPWRLMGDPHGRIGWLRHPNLSCVLSRKVRHLPWHFCSSEIYFSFSKYTIFKSYLTRAKAVIVAIVTVTVTLFGVVKEKCTIPIRLTLASGSVCPAESNRLHPERNSNSETALSR